MVRAHKQLQRTIIGQNSTFTIMSDFVIGIVVPAFASARMGAPL